MKVNLADVDVIHLLSASILHLYVMLWVWCSFVILMHVVFYTWPSFCQKGSTCTL